MTTITNSVQSALRSQGPASREMAIRWVSVYGDEVRQVTGVKPTTDRRGAAAQSAAALIQWVSVHGDELLAPS
jgi:hypothetical protein